MSQVMKTWRVSMYNSEGIWLRTDETTAVSAAKAINNIKWRWRGLSGVHFRAKERKETSK